MTDLQEKDQLRAASDYSGFSVSDPCMVCPFWHQDCVYCRTCPFD